MTESTNPPEVEDDTDTEAVPEAADPVQKWTKILLIVALILMGWYVVSDRVTPYTTQARLHALVVPIAAEVSGSVTEVLVGNNQLVSAGDVLFKIDRGNYEIALENALANLQTARQGEGASSANVDAAEASLGAARANLRRAEQDTVRLLRIKEEDPGAISDRRLESSQASLDVAREQLTGAQAQLERARQDLGQTGADNARIRQAQAAVDKAQLDLTKTSVVAPADGLVTDVRVERGKVAGAGSPVMTFVATRDVWLQADFTENNLGNVDKGDPVEIAFDVFPGRVFKGSVRGVGFGVDVDQAPLGSLPTIRNDRAWLRDAQRFPVDVDFDMTVEDQRKLRVGAQASVIIFAEGGWFFNSIGKLQLRIASVLSYAY